MSGRDLRTGRRFVEVSLVSFLIAAGPAWAQQPTSTSSTAGRSNDAKPVVRTFGTGGGFRTEVTSRTIGSLSEEDRRQASILIARVFEHIGKARDALDADDTERALREVTKAREAVKAIRAMMPRATVHTRTTAPDGKVIYEDDEEVQARRIPLYEGMLHAQTLAPILASRRNAMEVAGVQVVESERIATEVIADIDPIESQLERAAKALEHKKPEDAAKALAMALIRGLDLRFSKEDSELASARDEIWLARRSLEENNPTQALANLAAARQRLRIYREILPQDQRQEVDQMLQEIDQLEAQLRQEGTGTTVTREERARQGRQVTHWWDRINSWFKRHF
jgi:YfdX protein